MLMKGSTITLVAALIIIVGFVRPAAVEPINDASNAEERGDYPTAIRIWSELATQGDPAAQNHLGEMYDRGHGVTRDRATAVIWFRKAADQGFAAGQLNLGVMYEVGLGVPQDFVTAALRYRRAAEQGNAGAQLNLGAMYENGWGVRQDYVIALMWFNLSAAGGDRHAPRNRDLIVTKMTGAQVAQAEKLTREWGHASAQQ
jgi:uncharacterized protein